MLDTFGGQAGANERKLGWKALRLQGWGRCTESECIAARPERMLEMVSALTPPDGRSLIAHGAGRSYGDAGLNSFGAAVLTTRLDRIISFEASTGLLVAEPGVTFADLMAIFLPKGFLVPVSPGTGFVTLGGAVANDVHGKNHHQVGSIGDHIPWFELLVPGGQILRVSAASDADLFRATLGGVGLTGIVIAICLRMIAVPSNAVAVQRRRIGSLDAFLDAFRAASGARYSVGWIDALASGRAMGRGIIETAEPSESNLAPIREKRRRLLFEAPGWMLNGLSVRAFNALYWRRSSVETQVKTVHYRSFLYPLDAIEGWNKLYGKRGFRQFQCVVPFGSGERALQLLLETISAAGAASFLAVLKVMGPQGRGMLSFGMPGYSLALDIPAKPGSRDLFAALERITRDFGGRIYLAKDSMMSADGFAAMYPEAGAFRAVRARVDPMGTLSSDMARRLGL